MKLTESINAVTDLLEVPGLCILLVFASDGFILDSQLSHNGSQVRTLNSVHLHVDLVVSQTSPECIYLLWRKIMMLLNSQLNS